MNTNTEELNGEPQDTPYEQFLYERYTKLGRVSSDADAERKSLKTEVQELLRDGILLEGDTHFLTFQYETRFSFDHEKAFKEGAITQEVLEKYGKPTVIEKIVNVSKETKLGKEKLSKFLDHAEAMLLRQTLESLQERDLPDDLAEAIRQALHNGS